jgi:two-component system sensor histidine kinase/response regulator
VRTHLSLKKTKDELEKKNLELEKALEMKDEFLSLVSHEFRTPLNVISSAIQAMSYIYGSELPYKAKKYLAMIRQNTFRQLRLVNNLLDITRVNAGRIKVNRKNIDIVFLTKAIVESVYTYAVQKTIDITFFTLLEEKVIAIDEEKYERILLNLLSNAIKFTPEGKSITVTLSCIKNQVCVEIKDNGIGIPLNKLEVIFERFGQVDSSLSRQAEGTGIGLSLVKKFTEALGGSIAVKSEEGKGSTFTILLPGETIIEENREKEAGDLLDNRLVQTTRVEFSDIYL